METADGGGQLHFRRQLKEHRIGSYDRGLAGPLVLAVGGLHGNEPDGVDAVSALLMDLAESAPGFNGRLVALAGNLGALAQGRRLIDEDLNRMWSVEGLERVHSGSNGSAESHELTGLKELIEAEVRQASGPVLLLDLHSTSAPGAPFSILADTLQNRPFVEALPIPTVFGLEEHLDGPLLTWFTNCGHSAIVVEGGRNRHGATRENLANATWILLGAAGCIDPQSSPVRRAHECLSRATPNLPGVLEVVHMHPLDPGDRFEMRPGYRGFQAVDEGEILAEDRDGFVKAPQRARILMPLYQGEGEDGFFLCRSWSHRWLRFSTSLRTSGLQGLLPALPGVFAHRDIEGALWVQDFDELRPMVREFLRVFGYRKVVVDGKGLALLRRPERRGVAVTYPS